jgi:RNA polymerase sigma factor FliA
MDRNDRDRSTKRDELIAKHLHFPEVIARQFAATPTRAAFLEDLIAAGNVGLVEAAEHFDPERGVRFSTFAWPRIRGAMVDGLRTSARYRRSDVARHRAGAACEPTCRVAVRRADADSSDELAGAEEALDVNRCLPRLGEALARLPRRERELMELHYFGGLPLSQIAARMGVHRSWCTRLHQQALALLHIEIKAYEPSLLEMS